LHWKLNAAALSLGAVAFAAIALSKYQKEKAHFESTHAKWGFATFVSALGIGAVGSLLKWLPKVVGGPAIAKKLYPCHRAFGYLLTGLLIMTLYYALEKKWVKEWMGLNLWTANLVALPVIAGLLLVRVSWSKLVFGMNKRQQ
jgi:cytochrome b561